MKHYGKNKPVVFLDCDGVLNNTKWLLKSVSKKEAFNGTAIDHRKPEYWACMVCPENLVHVRKLVTEADADIVVSSAWRIWLSTSMFRTVLALVGWDNAPVIARTTRTYKPHLDSRGAQIEHWISTNKFTGPYVILDDDMDFLPSQMPVFVHTNFGVGMTANDYIKALAILQQEV